MFFATGIKIKHLNFIIKEDIFHLILLLSLQYCYATKICSDFSMKVKGRINKEMVERMKRKESLDSEPKRQSTCTRNRLRGKEKKKDGSDFFQ